MDYLTNNNFEFTLIGFLLGEQLKVLQESCYSIEETIDGDILFGFYVDSKGEVEEVLQGLIDTPIQRLHNPCINITILDSKGAKAKTIFININTDVDSIFSLDNKYVINLSTESAPEKEKIHLTLKKKAVSYEIIKNFF